MGDDPQIVGVEFTGPLVDVGAAAAKAMEPSRRYRYKRPIKYILIDGRTCESQVTGESKPKLQANYDRIVKRIAEGGYFAILRDGKLIGNRIVMSLV